MLVDINASFKLRRISLGVELRGVDVLLVADHLVRAGWRAYQVRAALWQGLQRLLMADKGIKVLGKVFGQRVYPARLCEAAMAGARRLAVVAFVHRTSEVVAKNADAIAAAEKRDILLDNLGHKGKHRRLDLRLGRGFGLGGVRYTTGATANDNTTVRLQIEAVRQRLHIQPDAVGLRRGKPRLLQDGGVFAIRSFRLGAELEDEEHGGNQSLPFLRLLFRSKTLFSNKIPVCRINAFLFFSFPTSITFESSNKNRTLDSWLSERLSKKLGRK